MDETTKEFKEASKLWHEIDELDEQGNDMAIIKILMDLLAKTKEKK